LIVEFKLDENFGHTIQRLFLDQGHDCVTVREEHLAGASDDEVLKAACNEKRVLVTMDYDFSNVLRYPPHQTSGIVVINAPGRASIMLLKNIITLMLDAISVERVRGRLWIVEPGRIREHEPAPDTEEEK
jgi:predicted nuclease of predicted toxin-antitoxin system